MSGSKPLYEIAYALLRPVLLVGLMVVCATSTAIPAILAEEPAVKGKVEIKGDLNEVTWDDEGISTWDADGNIYLKFTSDEGRVVEMKGDHLSYRREPGDTSAIHWVSITGNTWLSSEANTLNAGKIEGTLSPIDFEISDNVTFEASGFSLSSAFMTLVENDVNGTPLYISVIPGEMKGVFTRQSVEAPPPLVKSTNTAIPLPVDLNPDFETMDITAPSGTVHFNDDEFLDADFPDGASAVTDTGYTFTGDALTMQGMREITSSGCTIIGPEVSLRCKDMTFHPDDRTILLDGDVGLVSKDAAMKVDALTIKYDDLGISELTASGNIVLDFSIFLFKEGEQTISITASPGDATEPPPGDTGVAE